MSSSDTSLRPVADARDVDDCCRCMASPADHTMGLLLTCIYLSNPSQTAQQTKELLHGQLPYPVESSCRTMRQMKEYMRQIWHRSVLKQCKISV